MILQTEHLSKSYGGRTLFHDVTFRLEEYDRLALVGPNGCLLYTSDAADD